MSKSRTYFVVDEEQMSEFVRRKINGENVYFSNLIIYGYFSLALKVLSVPEHFGTNQRKKFDGLSAKIHGRSIKDFPCYLIGQLSRNSFVSKENMSGEIIINYALSIIKQSIESIGGRIVLVECRNEKKLIRFYKDNGFNIIDDIPDGENQMIQMVQVYRNENKDEK